MGDKRPPRPGKTFRPGVIWRLIGLLMVFVSVYGYQKSGNPVWAIALVEGMLSCFLFRRRTGKQAKPRQKDDGA